MSDRIDPKDITLNPDKGLTTSPVIDPADIDIFQPNPYLLTQPSTLTDDRSVGVDNTLLDLNRPFHMDLNEHRAQRQTTMDKWISGGIKGVSTLVTATGESFGAIGGGIVAGTMVALGDDWDSDIVFKNPVLTFFKELNEDIKERNPNYYSEAEMNDSVLANLATHNFWSDKFLDGLGFLGSALLTGLGAASVGAKLGLAGAGKIGAGLNSIQAAIAGRTGESAIEANETYERVIEELKEKRKLGENNLSDTEIEERAKTARASTFGFNMALAVTDAYQLGKVFKTVKGQKVGRGLFGRSRVGHAAEQALIESQEENYQLAVSNMAIHMANNMVSPENEAGAGEYVGRIVGGMMDNFGTKEGQESMVLGGLLGGGMGLAFKSNDRTEKAKKDVGNEFLERSNSLLHIFKNDIELDTIKKLALGKKDMVTARLAETNQLINLVYSKIITNKFEDFQKEVDALATEEVSELKNFDVEITKEEQAQQYADIKPKISLYKAFYDSIDPSLHKAIRGNLYYLLTSRDAIQKEMLAADEKIVAIDALIARNKASDVKTELGDPMSFGSDTIIPSKVLADKAKLKVNEQIITEQLNKVKDNPIVQDAIIKRYEDGITEGNPNLKPTEDPDTVTKPLGTLQKPGIPGDYTPFYKKSENDDGTITYTLKDEEGKESIITAQPGEYVESGITAEEIRGERIELFNPFTRHEVTTKFAQHLPALRNLLATDPNWREKIVIRVNTSQNQEGTTEERIAAYNASGQVRGMGGVFPGVTEGRDDILLIPSSTINFNLFMINESGKELLVGHVVDPLKYTDGTGTPIDFSQITEEEFYEIFTFLDKQSQAIQDDVQYEAYVREQQQAIEFFEAVNDWAEKQEDNTELPAEFMDVFTNHMGWDHTEVGEWTSPTEHEMLKDDKGNYVIVDTRGDTPFKSIVDGTFYGDQLSEETLEQLENTRYIAKVHHPTVEGLWVKAAPKNMTQKSKNELARLIEAAKINPTQKQVDELNERLYIAYKQSWNFAFDIKKNKGEANELRLDVFNRPAGIAERNIVFPVDVPFINLTQLVTMLQDQLQMDLGEFPFKENLTKDNITNDQVEAIFTINTNPDVIKGVGLHFGFKTDNIKLKPEGGDITVFHGTSEEFDEFDFDQGGTGFGAQKFGKGVYVTTSKKAADKYRRKAVNLKTGKTATDTEGQIVEMTINLKNPIDAKSEEFKKLREEFKDDAELTAALKEKGYDGVIYKQKNSDNYVVFDAEQITYKEKDDLKAKAAKDVEDSSNAVDNVPFKKSPTKATEIIDIPSAKKWLKKHLPAGMKTADIDAVLDNLEDNQYTWGMFADNVVYLSKFAGVGTEYHEAFHAIFRNMTTKAERKVLYKEAVAKWGSGKSPLFYEEKMADEFMKWKLDQTRKESSTLRKIFKRLMSYIKMITKQGTELEILFRRIDHGAFANKAIKNRESIEFNSPAWKLLKGGKRYKMSVVRSEDVIYTAASYVLNKIGDLTWTRDHDTVIENLIDEHMDTQAVFNDYKSNVNKDLAKDPKVAAELADLEAIYLNPTNRELVKEEVKKLLDIYEIRPIEVAKEEDDINEESERRFDIHQGEVGGWKNINKEIKQLIALTTFNTTDDYNRKITRAVNFIPTFTLLQRALAGKERPEQLKEFASRARYDEQVKAVYEKFIKITGYKKDGTMTNEMMYNRFLNSFELFPINSIQALRMDNADGVTELRNLSANQNSPEKIHMENWARTAHDRNIFNSVESRNKAGNILLLASSSFNLVDPKKIYKKDVDKVVNAFEPLGINLSPGFVQESLEEHYGLRSESGNRMLAEEDISVLAGILKKGDDLYAKKLDDNGEIIDATAAIGTLTDIARGDIMYRSDIYETNFQNSQNKSIFAFVLPSYILHKTRELGQMTPAKLKQLRKDPYFKYNPLIHSVNAEETFKIIEAAFTGDYRDDLNPDKEGVTFKDTTSKDLLLTLYGLYKSPNKYSYFTPMIYEAKSTSISLKLPRKEGGWLSKGKLSQNTLTFFRETLFNQEHQRINGNTGIDFIKRKTNPWVTLPFFNGVEYRNKYLTEYSLEEIEKDKDLKDLIEKTIAEGILADVKRHKQDLVDFGIVEKDKNLLNIPTNEVSDYVTNFYLDDFINSVAVSQLLTGDLAKFKNSFDNVKRMAGILAYGTHFGDGTYNVVYKKEDEVPNDEYGNNKKLDRDDAQVYVSVQRRINQLARHGRLDAKKRRAYEKIRDGNDLTAEESKLIDVIPLKTVHFDGDVYHKMSETMLSRALVSDHVLVDGKGVWVAKPGKEKLHNMLQFMMDNKVDSVVTLSASKVQLGKNSLSGKTATVLTEEDFVKGTFPLKEDLVIADLQNQFIRVQVEMRSGKDKIVSGTQMAQLIDSLYSNPELQQELYQLMADNRLSDFAQAQFIADPENVEKLAEKFIHNLESTGGDAQIIKLLETVDAGNGKRKFKYNINLPHIAEKIEQLMLSHFSKGVLQQKVPGYKLTLMAASGYQIVDEVTGKTRDLRMHRISKDGKTIELAEVVMTRRKLGQILGHDVSVTSLSDVNKELLEMVGTRIPTQAHHSMIPFKVVEFMPEFYGDTVIAPAGITKLSGADYDIDSLFVYRKDFYEDVNGNIVVYGDAVTDEDLYTDYIQYHLDNNKDLLRTFTATQIAFKDFTPIEVIESVFPDFGLAGTFEDFLKGDKITNAARNNRIVEIYLEILTDPSVDDMFQASSLDLLHSASSTYYSDIKNEGNKSGRKLHHSVAGKLQSHKDTSTGKRNVGPIAAANATSAFMTKSKINMRVPIVFLGKKYWNYDVKEEDDIVVKQVDGKWTVLVDGRIDKSKTTSLSTLLSGMTDDAKWGFSNMLNLKQYNLGTFANMIALGMGFNRTMLFASQPVLVELSKRVDQSDLSETRTINEFIGEQVPIPKDLKLTEELLLENLTKNDPEINALIMSNYEILNAAAKKFQAVSTILGLNKGLEVNNLVDFNAKAESIEIAMAQPLKPFFTNLNTAVHANPNTHHNLEIFDKIGVEMRRWFIAESNVYKTATRIIKPTLKTLRDKDAKTYDRALKSFLAFVGLNAWLKDKGVTTELSDYNALVNPSITVEGIEKTLAKQLSELSSQKDKVKAKAFNTNEFIKVIQWNFKYIKEGFRNTKNKLGIDNVVSSMRIQRSPLTVDRIRDGFVEIFLEYPALARDFLKFAIAKDNLQFTSSSFLKYIDVALLTPISEGLDLVMALDSTNAQYEFAKLFAGYKPNTKLTRVTQGVRPLTKEIEREIIGKTQAELEIDYNKKKLPEEDREAYVQAQLDEQALLPYIIKVKVNKNVYRLLYKEKLGELRWVPLIKFGSASQLPYHNLTYQAALYADNTNSLAIASDKAPINPNQGPEIIPLPEAPPMLDVTNLKSKDGTSTKPGPKLQKISESQEVNEDRVNYSLKAFALLSTDKAKEVFAKGKKNNWDLNKILTELQVPKEQKILILEEDKTEIDDILTSLASEHSFAVEVTVQGEQHVAPLFDEDAPPEGEYAADAGAFPGEEGIPVEEIPGRPYDPYEGAELDMPLDPDNYTSIISDDELISNSLSGFIPSQIYRDLTVPGGVFYTENEIATPDIIPGIQGHAQFSTPNGIGWFRSDRQDSDQNTRRILEIQSDLFQKGRNSKDLITKLEQGNPLVPTELFTEASNQEYESATFTTAQVYFGTTGFGYSTVKENDTHYFTQIGSDAIEDHSSGFLDFRHEDTYGKISKEAYNKFLANPIQSKENDFLQLLNKKSNWVNFFVQSIIHDSVKKGYNRVLFPTGETASKVEGIETLREEAKFLRRSLQNHMEKKALHVEQIQNYEARIKYLNSQISEGTEAIPDFDVKIHATAQGRRIITLDGNQIGQGKMYGAEGVSGWFEGTLDGIGDIKFNSSDDSVTRKTVRKRLKNDYKRRNPNKSKLEEKLEEAEFILKSEERSRDAFDREISRTNDRLEDVTEFGADKLGPIEAFYENRVTNILNKLYTVTQSTDEHGNTWNMVSLAQEGIIDRILLQKDSIGLPISETKDTLSKDDTTETLISYNFNKAIEKLSKRFKVPVELVHQPDAKWRGKFQDGTVFLNTAHLKSDTPFHEFAHPFIEAIAKKNPTLYKNLEKEIIEEGHILEKVTRLYPELEHEGRIDEAIVTAIGMYAADIANVSKSLGQKILEFLKEMIYLIKDLFIGDTLILPASLNPKTSLRDLSAIMAKGEQTFKLGDLSKDETKYQKQQATKLTVQPEHVDLVRKGDKTLSLRDYDATDENRVEYDVGDEVTIYSQGREQGIVVKLTKVDNYTSLSNVNKEDFAKALGYASFKEFIAEDLYAKEDSEMSMKFPAVYHFLHDTQSTQFLTYEVVREFETGAETELETKVKGVKEALIKQINKLKSQIVETNPKKDIAKLYVKRAQRLLKALDAIDDAKGLMSFIETADIELRKLRLRLEKSLSRITEGGATIHSISNEKRKSIMSDIFEVQEAITAYHILDELEGEDLVELIGESDTTTKFVEAQGNYKGIKKLIDKNGVPMMASWLLTFSNVDSSTAQAEFDARIARIKSTEMSEAKKTRIIKGIIRDQEKYLVTQESLEDQLRAATRDIGYGALMLEAAISSSDQVTSLLAKAVKTQEWRANMIDRVTQERIGVALDAFEKERKSKGVNPSKFYKDLYEEKVLKKGQPKELVLKETAPTKAGQDLLNVLREVYQEAQDKLPESIKMGNILPYVRKSGNDRLQEDGFFSTMKAEWKEIYTPLATDTAYGYMKADGTPVKQVPIHYVYRGEGEKAMSNADISKDLVHSVLLFSQMANKYEAFKNIQAEVDLFEKILAERTVKETDAQGANIIDIVAEKVGLAKYIESDTARVNQRIQEFINMQYYGIQEKPWIATFGEHQVDMNKFLNFLGKWTGFSTLAFNFLSALNNIVLGNFYIFQEALARQHYGDMQFRLAKGNALYAKGTMRMFSDIGKITGLSKETQLIRHFDAIQGEFRDISGQFITGNKAKRLFTGSTMFFMNHAGEHQMQSSTLFAALASKLVKDRNGNEITLWDAYQLNKEGVLELQEGVQFSEKDFFDFRGKLNAINKSLHGNYNDFDKTIFQKHAIGRLVLMFRKFMSPGFRRRFGNLGFDNEMDELHEGYFRTTMRLAFDEYREFGKWVMRKENSLTDYEKANVKRTVAEFGMWISTMIMFAVASAAVDDDKDDWLNALVLYEIRRFQTELSFYFNPAEGLKIFKSPAATTTTIERAVKFGDQLLHTAMFDTEYTHYKVSGHGHQAGDSKLWVTFKKMLPIIQGIERTMTPEEAIKYFDKLY